MPTYFVWKKLDLIAGFYHTLGNYAGIYAVDKGDYEIIYGSAAKVPQMTAISGKLITSITEEFIDSSVLLSMAEETASTQHLTLSSALVTVMLVLVGLVVFGFICLIIAIVHAIKRKKGHPPYSPWWVIVPHLLLIFLFAILTRASIEQMVMIKIIVSALSTITMFLTFVLALRAFIRKKGKRNLITAGIMLVLCVLNWFFFQNSPFINTTDLSIGLYYLLIVVLSVVSLLGFFIKKKTVNAEQENHA